MDLKLFDNPSGEIVRSLEGHWAFVPRQLPPLLDLAKVAKPLASAMHQIGELKGASRRTANPYIFIRPLQRLEALTTSAMEGTHTNIDDLVLEEEGIANRRNEDAREASNFGSALRNAASQLRTLPISHRMIKEAHRHLLSGLNAERGSNKRPGEYKTHQNWIGGTKRIETARFVPPPPDHTLRCMDQLETYIDRSDITPADSLLDLAFVHYQFEAIHPFADGNGRLGRMIVTLMAMQSGLLDLPLLYLSPILEGRKDEYIERMFNVSAHSHWEDWVNFFMTAVVDASKATTTTIDRLIALQKDYRKRAANAGRSSKLIEIVDGLFESPYLTIPRTQERFGVTHRAAKLMLEKLVDAGILRASSGTVPKLFHAAEILALSKGQ